MTIDDVQKICSLLPGVTEDIKWEHDLVFSVGNKMFFVVGLDRVPTSVSFKVSDEAYPELCARPGFTPAPYLARYKWVLVEDISKLRKTDMIDFVHNSYALVKEKLPLKLRKEMDPD